MKTLWGGSARSSLEICTGSRRERVSCMPKFPERAQKTGTFNVVTHRSATICNPLVWINLPREKKNSPPENQTLESKLAPVINQEGSEVRLLAGKYASRESPIKTMSPLILLDVQLAPNSTLNLSLPGAFFIGTYVVDGSGIIGNQEITSSSITLSNPTSSDETILCCSSQVSGLRFLLYGGEPLKEPIDVDGFFVCSTTEETKQTVKDFHDRKNGFQAGSNWKSNILGNLN